MDPVRPLVADPVGSPFDPVVPDLGIFLIDPQNVKHFPGHFCSLRTFISGRERMSL